MISLDRNNQDGGLQGTGLVPSSPLFDDISATSGELFIRPKIPKNPSWEANITDI